MSRLHLLLGVQSLLLVLASLNRLTGLTDAAILPGGSLRVLELLNLLVIPPASALAFLLLLEYLLAGAGRRARLALRVAFAGALYLFALSYGMHEPANFLGERYCGGDASALCDAIAYHDDGLSHLLFFAGFAGIAIVLLAAQAIARGPELRRAGLALVLANAALVAGAIVANLAFEPIGLDLVPVALVALVALVLLGRVGPRPLVVYFAAAYSAGLIGVVAL